MYTSPSHTGIPFRSVTSHIDTYATRDVHAAVRPHNPAEYDAHVNCGCKQAFLHKLTGRVCNNYHSWVACHSTGHLNSDDWC